LLERAKNHLDQLETEVRVKLNVRHHDADIHAMFNDPENQPSALFELDRVARFERP
jgi:hypothetical protein